MNSNIAPTMVITPHVVDTINSLPADERGVISAALAQDFILGRDPSEMLTPIQRVIYAMIKSYVSRDTLRHRF